MSSTCTNIPPSAVLRITGEDHLEFLQSQGTADLRGPVGLCRYCLWLDFRGAIQGDSFVLKESDSSMLLVSYSTTAAQLVSKFDRHIIADDVEMEDVTGDFRLISLNSGSLPEVLQADGWCLPGSDSFSTHEGGYGFYGRRLGQGFLDLLVPTAFSLQGPFNEIDEEEAESQRILSGIPSIPMDADDFSLNPIEANILSAISFEKGCYLGQEVVARVHRLERLSRRLVRFSGKNPSMALSADLHIEGKRVGRITSASMSGADWIALGWLKSRYSDGEISFDEAPLIAESTDPS